MNTGADNLTADKTDNAIATNAQPLHAQDFSTANLTSNSNLTSSTPDQDAPDIKHEQSARSALSARLKTSKDVELYVFEEEHSKGKDTLPLVDIASLDLDIDQQETQSKQQILFKREQGRLLLLLPDAPAQSFTPVEWEELCQQLKFRLNSEDRFFQPNTTVHLIARDRLLDSRQLQEIDDLLQTAQLRMRRIYTQRRQTAVAAATAGYSIEQQVNLEHLNDSQDQGKAPEAPLYLQMTIRSGTEIRHPGSIIVLGDINPGGTVIATGDIFVWGRLRGLAHAGSEGNEACRIMALHMQPTQLRIAEHVARAPEKPPAMYEPEVAYVNKEGIRIAIASEFARMHLNGS
ncbi:MAG: septum site-determining protein MinC [Leptolyngbya sp. SIO3F4]|nr:septum site-determining protein MinC [Leptolyngbya sp. SIO3F4]